MNSLRKTLFKPRVDDWSPLAQFYHADEALNAVAAELDSFDGRRDPDRCNQLVGRLRQCQDRVLQIIQEMLAAVFPNESERASRDYRVKFPDDILHDNLAGQLWFGAECLAAGSNIIDHEFESEAIRPLAKSLTRHLERLREQLKDQALRNSAVYPDKLKKHLRVFDHVFAEFELCYVSAMVPVKTVSDYDSQLDVAVLFSETLSRAIAIGYVTSDQVDSCDPIIMITLPRLAIVCGLLIFSDGPLSLDRRIDATPEMFRPFHTLLRKIRDLLHVLSENELCSLERSLCSCDEPQIDASVTLISDYRASRADERCHSVDADSAVAISLPRRPADVEAAVGQGSPSSVDAADERRASVDADESPAESESMDADEEVDDDDDGRQLECAFDNATIEYEISYSGVRRKPTAESIESERKSLRLRFRSSEDLIHRLFVCVAGVADQLQTNYPSDLRSVLKLVLQPNERIEVFEVSGRTAATVGNEEETGMEAHEGLPAPSFVGARRLSLPSHAVDTGVRWVPDAEGVSCFACGEPFTLVRRRHHCRNCGRIFCGRCSPNSLPLPGLGYPRRVRVCNQCFMFHLNPFTESPAAAHEDVLDASQQRA